MLSSQFLFIGNLTKIGLLNSLFIKTFLILFDSRTLKLFSLIFFPRCGNQEDCERPYLSKCLLIFSLLGPILEEVSKYSLSRSFILQTAKEALWSSRKWSCGQKVMHTPAKSGDQVQK